MTILLTTHYLDEAQRLCDRVAIMNRGAVAALDTPAALLAGLGGEILEMRVEGDASAALASLRAHGFAAADTFTVGSTVTVPLRHHTAAQAIAAIDATDLRAAGITTRTPTLDDVYLRLTGNQLVEAA
jgi:ABC-2 type transport system ATP-binding protein